LLQRQRAHAEHEDRDLPDEHHRRHVWVHPRRVLRDGRGGPHRSHRRLQLDRSRHVGGAVMGPETVIIAVMSGFMYLVVPSIIGLAVWLVVWRYQQAKKRRL